VQAIGTGDRDFNRSAEVIELHTAVGAKTGIRRQCTAAIETGSAFFPAHEYARLIDWLPTGSRHTAA
jgi:hypothetical protein